MIRYTCTIIGDSDTLINKIFNGNMSDFIVNSVSRPFYEKCHDFEMIDSFSMAWL